MPLPSKRSPVGKETPCFGGPVIAGRSWKTTSRSTLATALNSSKSARCKSTAKGGDAYGGGDGSFVYLNSGDRAGIRRRRRCVLFGLHPASGVGQYAGRGSSGVFPVGGKGKRRRKAGASRSTSQQSRRRTEPGPRRGLDLCAGRRDDKADYFLPGFRERRYEDVLRYPEVHGPGSRSKR